MSCLAKMNWKIEAQVLKNVCALYVDILRYVMSYLQS